MPRYNTSVPIPFALFNTTPPAYAHREGLIAWDSVDGTIAVMLADGDTPVKLQVGQEQYIRIRNNTGSEIANGAAVYCVGSLSYRPTVALSQADAIGTSKVAGIATQDIPINTEGVITTLGLVRDFDTQTPGWAEGDTLYLSETVAGGLKNAAPASGYTVIIGKVLRRHPTDGIIVVRPTHTPAFGDIDGGDYTAFEFDGTMHAAGAASAWKDELQQLIGSRLESPSSDVQLNLAEGSVTFEATARYPTDYVVVNIQLNHVWELGTQIHPHLHWWQVSADEPNWLIGYRWQIQGGAKDTSWSLLPGLAGEFTYTAGTLNQITEFGPITPPGGYGEVSDILQFRIYRDVTNVSTEFAGADPESADIDAINFDAHIEVDTLGSRTEYTK